jgi:hypothetical protein
MIPLTLDIRCPGRDLNQELPKYKSEFFQLETYLSVATTLAMSVRV